MFQVTPVLLEQNKQNWWDLFQVTPVLLEQNKQNWWDLFRYLLTNNRTLCVLQLIYWFEPFHVSPLCEMFQLSPVLLEQNKQNWWDLFSYLLTNNCTLCVLQLIYWFKPFHVSPLCEMFQLSPVLSGQNKLSWMVFLLGVLHWLIWTFLFVMHDHFVTFSCEISQYSLQFSLAVYFSLCHSLYRPPPWRWRRWSFWSGVRRLCRTGGSNSPPCQLLWKR